MGSVPFNKRKRNSNYKVEVRRSVLEAKGFSPMHSIFRYLDNDGARVFNARSVYSDSGIEWVEILGDNGDPVSLLYPQVVKKIFYRRESGDKNA